jgi:2,3-bisphosphoglycerate-dependent phosphoglycerate mutase
MLTYRFENRNHKVSLVVTTALLLFTNHSCSLLVAVSALALEPSPIHRLLLCRHGDSIWNGGQEGLVEKFTGWTDVPLSAKGQEEAAGRTVALYSYDIDVCTTSVLGRAQATATHILQHHTTKTIVDYRLNERHYGASLSSVRSTPGRGMHH